MNDAVVLTSLLLTLNIFPTCSTVSIVNFEQANAGWVIALLKIWFKRGEIYAIKDLKVKISINSVVYLILAISLEFRLIDDMLTFYNLDEVIQYQIKIISWRALKIWTSSGIFFNGFK